MPMLARSSATALLLLTAALATGCSADRQIIQSTINRPASVAIVDATTLETLWTMDVPVAHSLMLDFNNRSDIPGVSVADSPATSVIWRLYKTREVQTSFIGGNQYHIRGVSVDHEQIELPGTPIRTVVSYREKAKEPPPPATAIEPLPAPRAPEAPVEAEAPQPTDTPDPLEAESEGTVETEGAIEPDAEVEPQAEPSVIK